MHTGINQRCHSCENQPNAHQLALYWMWKKVHRSALHLATFFERKHDLTTRWRTTMVIGQLQCQPLNSSLVEAQSTNFRVSNSRTVLRRKGKQARSSTLPSYARVAVCSLQVDREDCSIASRLMDDVRLSMQAIFCRRQLWRDRSRFEGHIVS